MEQKDLQRIKQQFSIIGNSAQLNRDIEIAVQVALTDLSVLITGQAFMHMLVNVDIMPMTGQTLPLISDGASAFLMSCLAFGIILSISRMAKKKVQAMEESMISAPEDDIQERITILEQIEDNINE